MDNFIPKEILDELSYTSTLGQSLKQISLSKTPVDRIIQDVCKEYNSYRIGFCRKIRRNAR